MQCQLSPCFVGLNKQNEYLNITKTMETSGKKDKVGISNGFEFQGHHW